MFYGNIYTKERTETFDNELKIKKIYIISFYNQPPEGGLIFYERFKRFK